MKSTYLLYLCASQAFKHVGPLSRQLEDCKYTEGSLGSNGQHVFNGITLTIRNYQKNLLYKQSDSPEFCFYQDNKDAQFLFN